MTAFQDWQHPNSHAYEPQCSGFAHCQSKTPRRNPPTQHIVCASCISASILKSASEDVHARADRLSDVQGGEVLDRYRGLSLYDMGARCRLSDTICTNRVERYPRAILQRLLQHSKTPLLDRVSANKGIEPERIVAIHGSLYSELGLPTHTLASWT